MRDINKYEADYLVEGFEKYQVEYRRKMVLDRINRYSSKKILEIGCGMEPLFQYVDNYKLYYFFEPAKGFYENAKKLANDDKRIIGYNEQFYYNNSIASQKLDIIICSSLLHELEDVEEFLLNIRETANTETVIHINVPNARSFHRLLAVEAGIIEKPNEFSKRNKTYQQNRVYDMDSLSDDVQNAGFRIISSGSFFVKPFTHSQMWEMLKNDIIDKEILNGLYKLSKAFPDNGSEIFVDCMIE